MRGIGFTYLPLDTPEAKRLLDQLFADGEPVLVDVSFPGCGGDLVLCLSRDEFDREALTRERGFCFDISRIIDMADPTGLMQRVITRSDVPELLSSNLQASTAMLLRCCGSHAERVYRLFRNDTDLLAFLISLGETTFSLTDAGGLTPRKDPLRLKKTV